MEINEKRREERNTYEISEGAYVELKVPGDHQTYKMYDLKVNDCSRYGLGMLISQEDFDLLRILQEGDKLQNMAFFSTWTVNRVEGVVRHKTKIEEGKYKGCYIVGIKSEDIIDHCKPEVH
ncbi:MAG: hypothetical protein JRJ65_12335 [Deltaproteobacteria bacterium]|nr:hypothetical protein [Deltaproteobacteria bacterium]